MAVVQLPVLEVAADDERTHNLMQHPQFPNSPTQTDASFITHQHLLAGNDWHRRGLSNLVNKRVPICAIYATVQGA